MWFLRLSALLLLSVLVSQCHARSIKLDRALLEKFEELELPKFDDNFMSALEVAVGEGEGAGGAAGGAGGAGGGAVATYLPDSGPYDNPVTDITPTKTLPETPSCTIRGQTIFEIRKMRADANQIGMAIMYEIQIMEKRKAYVEQMTSYLNDRIRELNKVKTDLAAEQKWIEVSNARITELAQKEKLIKLQDVMSCIKGEQHRLTGDATNKQNSIKSLNTQASAITANINSIKTKIDQIIASTP